MMKIVYRNFIYEAVAVTETPAFKAWFGNSKVVDDDGEPLNVFHGTPHNFEVFDIRKTYKDAYVGPGFYFTSEPHDADKNYSSLGPDAINKRDMLVDEWNDLDLEELANVIGTSVDEVEAAQENGTLNELIKKKAEVLVVGENPAPNIMPVYLKIENPFYIGEGFRQYFDYHIPYDEETEEEGEPEGIGATLLDALQYELNELEYIQHDKTYAKINEELEPYDGGFSATEFFNAIKDADGLIDSYYGEETNTVGGFFKRIILRAGFDGVIMDASVFSDMEGTQGSNHYIVYQPNQIKSVFNKNPTSDPNITKE